MPHQTQFFEEYDVMDEERNELCRENIRKQTT